MKNRGIYETILKMPELMEKAYEELKVIGEIRGEVGKVAFFGMGGSGIAGRIISEWLNEENGEQLITCYNDMKMPKWVDEETIIIPISYSGNTKETIMATKTAIERKLNIAIISSGGKLIETAERSGIPYVKIPPIFNQPRESLPYLIMAAIKVLLNLKVINEENIKQIKKAIETLYNVREKIIRDKTPEKLAQKMFNKMIQIYTYNPLTAAAIRFKQSLNENSKTLAKLEIIPEAGHNAIMEFEGEAELLNKNIAIIIREGEIENKLIRISMEVFKELMLKRGMNVEEIISIGEIAISKILTAIYIGDLASIELANIKGVDAREIKSIRYLKSKIRE
ncbi:MAG: bifunctional phosphoglucose/phosphomannose isomerase [Candidatus Methanomethylicia archaeon]